jgi:hypothetical protein
LFRDEIDWDLIATHARDMIQVVLSIQAGRVMPSMLLRKLGTYNRKSLLYRAFRELGRVERTLFLLRFFSSTEVRRVIRAETTKIETYNEFLDWVCFGGPIVKSGDPVEQEKQLKYASLVANAVMLSNVADLTEVLCAMANDWQPVTADLVACTSPYLREHIRRFGRFSLDMADLPNRDWLKIGGMIAGSSSICVLLGWANGQHAGPQQFDAGAAVHGPFEGFQTIDLPLCLAVTPDFGDRVAYGCEVLTQ